MNKIMKICFIVAGALVLVGIIMFVVVMSILGWDFTKLSTVKYESNSYDITEAFDNINVKSNTAKFQFLLSEDGKCKIECYEDIKSKHSVAVNDGALEIFVVNEKKWYDYINIDINSNLAKITVYLPEAEYNSLTLNSSTGMVEVSKKLSFTNVDISVSTGAVRCYASVKEKLNVKTTTGDITLDNISVGAVDLKASTGRVNVSNITCDGDFHVKMSTGDMEISNVKCENITFSGNTSDIDLQSVIATQKINIDVSTGDVELEACDAGELFIVTDTGDVEATLLSPKVFVTKTDTGKVRVPSSIEGGRCEIVTDTGDIEIRVVK